MMISTCLKQLNKPEEFQKTMEALAKRHCEKGIRANEYGVVGDVLFYSLQYCLDQDIYDRNTELAWIRIYSAMLRAILPTALHFESTGEYDVSSRTFAQLRATGMNFQNRLSSAESMRASSREVESFYDDVGDGDNIPRQQLRVVVELSSNTEAGEGTEEIIG